MNASPPSATTAPATARRAARTAVLRAEARLYLREPGSLFWVLAFPPLLLAILGCIPMFREVSDDLDGLRPIDIYVPVTVLIGLIVVGAQAMPPVITGYRERGILRRMSTTPVRPAALLSAQMVLNGVAGLVSALLSVTLGRVVFDVALPRQFPAYLLVLLLALAASLSLGALISAWARTARNASAIGTVVFFPMLFCTGLWLPVRTMPDVMARVVEATPFGAAARALDQAAVGDWPAWSHLGVTAAWTAVLTAAAVRWFRWE
ncbi:ABC transporter permease [Streptomyces triticirhizae]|uniref:Transport permease protein n=1 Tax=Streptomyces triticirhizae TaxID=2483353 RepID=A0A3M2LKG6_9ACTN|nr:ABC transporter permease [Streptomyces triticirhizae]RMI37979.1 ABC transporter permease [Streptomyces triticirhizae]